LDGVSQVVLLIADGKEIQQIQSLRIQTAKRQYLSGIKDLIALDLEDETNMRQFLLEVAHHASEE
jgi:hypothetical protein